MWEHARAIFLESTERVVLSAARIVPSVVAILILTLAFTALAFLARGAVHRVLTRSGLDRRFRQWSFAAAESWFPDGSPTMLFERIAFWAVVVSGVLLGLGTFEPTSPYAMRLLAYVPQVLVAVVLFGVGVSAARFLEHSALVTAVNLRLQSARLLSLAVKWLVLVLATAMALHHLDIGGTLVTISFAILFGGIVLALALAVGLGSREAVSRTWEHRERERSTRAAELRHF